MMQNSYQQVIEDMRKDIQTSLETKDKVIQDLQQQVATLVSHFFLLSFVCLFVYNFSYSQIVPMLNGRSKNLPPQGLNLRIQIAGRFQFPRDYLLSDQENPLFTKQNFLIFRHELVCIFECFSWREEELTIFFRFLGLFTNGDNEGSKGYLSLFLFLEVYFCFIFFFFFGGENSDFDSRQDR